MNSLLLDDLRCCDCQSKLKKSKIIKDERGQVISGELACQSCAKIFPVIDKIPRFVSSDDYLASFSFEWEKHSRTQLEIDIDQTEKLFYQELGIKKHELQNINVLDAGIGPGRYAFVPIKEGSILHGIDMSNAINQASKNYKDSSNIMLAQADLQKLPYPEEYFDFIYSIGVLHHTPSPRASFLSLIPYLKPGGSISIVLYNKGALLYECSKRWRKYTSRFNTKFLYIICWLASLFLYPIYKLPILKLLIYYLPIDMHKKFEWRVLNTFDAYSPKYASTHTWSDVYEWFKEAGLRDIKLQDTDSICIRGWK